jgi:thiol-disulfide isomerase/thioredoxin
MPSPIIVGKVYADWCGHCQTLKPKWEQLKRILPKGRVQTVEIEESETEKRAEFETTHKKTINVSGYPTIFKIINNKIHYYSGPREPEDMKQWVLSGPSSSSKKTFRRGRRKSRGKRTTHKYFLNLF